MLYRRIAFSIIATVLVLLGGCNAESATFAFDRGALDLILDQVVSLEIFPVRRGEYLVGDKIAKTEGHLRVFAVYYNGNAREIPLDDTEVTLQEEEEDSFFLTKDPYLFETAGEKTLTVYYEDQKAQYTFIVYVSISSDDSSGDGTTIEIKPLW
jgi:hypothetical protein